jgi:hypothetical protein
MAVLAQSFDRFEAMSQYTKPATAVDADVHGKIDALQADVSLLSEAVLGITAKLDVVLTKMCTDTSS